MAARFVSLLNEVVVRDDLTVFAWVLMSNHYHLAVRTGSISLDRPMRSLQQRMTRTYNVRHSVFGPLWQGRSTGLERPAIAVNDFVLRGAEYLRVSIDELADRGRSPSIVGARVLLATLGIERYGMRVNEIARVINKSPEAVSRCISRGTRLRKADAEFGAKLEELDQFFAETTETTLEDD